MSQEKLFTIFFIIWAILGLFSFIVFFYGKNAPLKKRLWPPFIVGTSLLLLVFMYLMGMGLNSFYLMVPGIGLIAFLNLRSTKFCDACGRTDMNPNFFVVPEFCSKCGEKFR